jgi:hypothetical protein
LADYDRGGADNMILFKRKERPRGGRELSCKMQKNRIEKSISFKGLLRPGMERLAPGEKKGRKKGNECEE